LKLEELESRQIESHITITAELLALHSRERSYILYTMAQIVLTVHILSRRYKNKGGMIFSSDQYCVLDTHLCRSSITFFLTRRK
jgi:hypothetical protein